MRHPADHGERAEECRRLAKLCKRPEEWGHFLEMAETWEMVLRHQQERSRWKQSLSGDRFRNVLFLSDNGAKRSANTRSHENAA